MHAKKLIKTTILSSLLLLLITGSGCLTVKKWVLGIRGNEGKVETDSSIFAWIIKNKPIMSNKPAVKFYTYATAFEDFLQVNMSYGLSPLLINSRKEVVLFNGCTSDACLKDLASYIQNLKPDTLSSSSTLNKTWKSQNSPPPTFNEVNSIIYTTTGTKANIPFDSTSDYFLILPFALNYGNKKQVKDLRKFTKAASDNTYSQIQIAFLNLDKQQWWGAEKYNNVRISLGK